MSRSPGQDPPLRGLRAIEPERNSSVPREPRSSAPPSARVYRPERVAAPCREGPETPSSVRRSRNSIRAPVAVRAGDAADDPDPHQRPSAVDGFPLEAPEDTARGLAPPSKPPGPPDGLDDWYQDASASGEGQTDALTTIEGGPGEPEPASADRDREPHGKSGAARLRPISISPETRQAAAAVVRSEAHVPGSGADVSPQLPSGSGAAPWEWGYAPSQRWHGGPARSSAMGQWRWALVATTCVVAAGVLIAAVAMERSSGSLRSAGDPALARDPAPPSAHDSPSAQGARSRDGARVPDTGRMDGPRESGASGGESVAQPSPRTEERATNKAPPTATAVPVSTTPRRVLEDGDRGRKAVSRRAAPRPNTSSAASEQRRSAIEAVPDEPLY